MLITLAQIVASIFFSVNKNSYISTVIKNHTL